MKTKEELMIIELEKKAFEEGWIEGEHIFNFLDEVDMFKYDNLNRKIERNQAIDDFVEKCNEKGLLITPFIREYIIQIAKELKENGNN